MSAQRTNIFVCSGVRLDNRYDHSIYFDGPSLQREYFASKVVRTFGAYSYCRKSWPIEVDAMMEEAKTWNYLYFQNSPTGKYYYYFITNVEYKNPNTVTLFLELDVLQTYLFDFTFLPCFVERTHVENDNFGAHTIDEGLETGELIVNSSVDWEALTESCILVLSSINPNYAETDKPVPALAGMYDGVFSGLKVWAVNSTDWAAWGNQLDSLSAAGFIDNIHSMWMYPKALVRLGGENTWADDDLCKTVAGCKNLDAFIAMAAAPTEVDGYRPRNKKLLCFPFNVLYVTNNVGGAAAYKYERCGQGPIGFKAHGTLSPDGVVKMYPESYNGITNNYDEGLTLPNFPACAWDADTYKLWLAQNQNQHALSGVTSLGKVAGGAAMAIGGLFTGNLIGAGAGAATAISGGAQIAQMMAQKADMQLQPNQSRGNFSSSINMVKGKHTFTFQQKSITAEQARVLDDYFDMYGYRVSRVMVPKLDTRLNWTYNKTVGCMIQGSMCADDVVKIEAIFDRGITFWKHGDMVGDYNNPN